MSLPIRIALALVIAYASWLAMMGIHESGHVLAAWIGGGRVRGVTFPMASFSRTDVDPNPSPRLEVWGGPVIGSFFPLAVWIVLHRKAPRIVRTPFGFFTGLCLVANGAYLGLGWTMRAGDAADLMKLHTPAWLLIGVGTTMYVTGFAVWHTLGSISQLFYPGHPRID